MVYATETPEITNYTITNNSRYFFVLHVFVICVDIREWQECNISVSNDSFDG